MKRLALVLSLAMLLTTPGIALAYSDTDTTAIDCTVLPASIDIEAPSDITDWNLLIGDNTKTGKLKVTCNANWNVAVTDSMDFGKPAGTEGQMVEWTGSAYADPDPVSLANALSLQAPGQDVVTLDGTEQNLWSISQGPADGNFNISFNQQLGVAESDVLGKNVHVVVTFIGTTY